VDQQEMGLVNLSLLKQPAFVGSTVCLAALHQRSLLQGQCSRLHHHHCMDHLHYQRQSCPCKHYLQHSHSLLLCYSSRCLSTCGSSLLSYLPAGMHALSAQVNIEGVSARAKTESATDAATYGAMLQPIFTRRASPRHRYCQVPHQKTLRIYHVSGCVQLKPTEVLIMHTPQNELVVKGGNH